MKTIFHGFDADGPALRTERPRRAEGLSRQLGDGGKGICPSGELGGTPLGFGFFPPQGRDPSRGRPQIAYGVFNWISGRGEGQGRGRRKRHPSFVYEAATMRASSTGRARGSARDQGPRLWSVWRARACGGFCRPKPSGRRLRPDIVEKVGKRSGPKFSNLSRTWGRGCWMASRADDASR
jgi:hypothetical protein